MNVVSFYRFVDIADPQAMQEDLQRLCESQQLLGTVLLACEGINGTLAGGSAAIGVVFDCICKRLALAEPLKARWTQAGTAPFRRMKVRVKSEIVTLGRPDIRPHERTGRHVSPAAWHELLDDPRTLLIDTRNHYEIGVGTFPGALDPGTDSFRQFSAFAEKLAEGDLERPVAMYCTGGIRCEKASALMQELGFTDVSQLEGGVLHYLETLRTDEQRWNGECFVFDSRVAVDQDLSEGGYEQCHACRRPLSSDDVASRHYREGVSCPHCIDTPDRERTLRLEERRRQVALARERGEPHIGAKQRPPRHNGT